MPTPTPSCWDDLGRHGPQELFWQSDPAVRGEINRAVSGDASLWPILWFRGRMGSRLPFARALSVGCGPGTLERELVRAGIVRHVTGVDLAGTPLRAARRQAEREGMAGSIRYVMADARDLLRRERVWDAVFFHGSLHHFEDVEGTLELVAGALKPGGILYLDEYVGRSRGDWRWWHLVVPNLAYRAVNRGVRRTRVIRSPVTDEDPTEQIRSADILPATERFFKIREKRDYGGNLLLLIYPSLRRPGAGGPAPSELDRAVRRLLRLERFLLRSPLLGRPRSFHTVLWAESRTEALPSGD